ncbi:MAG: acyltransferase, partial [Rikenellaceae bacterium]|nr:acyltransferase [Rikenellaceae bacterium]
CRAFSVDCIHSEYGMAELTSQAYSGGGGIFRTPPWMKVTIRDLNDPFDIRPGGSGGINIIDLANRYCCAFIQTQDVGTVFEEGSFTVTGRADRSEVRGCNLLVQ